MVWKQGCAPPSWPPDGEMTEDSRLEILQIDGDIVMLVVAIIRQGSIVLINDRIWWCPMSALRGELTGSYDVRF